MKKNIKVTEKELVDGSKIKHIGEMISGAMEALVGVFGISTNFILGTILPAATIGGITFTIDGIRRIFKANQKIKAINEMNNNNENQKKGGMMR